MNEEMRDLAIAFSVAACVIALIVAGVVLL
jgi:hypothetical protein